MRGGRPCYAQGVTPLRFYFDFISPYSYVAWTQIRALATRHGRQVQPVPILFAALLEARGARGPAEEPARRAWLIKDVQRAAATAGVPLELPPAHPFNPLLALRIASLPAAPAELDRRIDALYRAAWAGGPGVTDPAILARWLDTESFDGDRLVAEAQTAAAKNQLRVQTDAALQAGVFGVPTVAADGELFFGFDNFPHLDRFLRGEDPVRSELVERWRTLPGITRR